MITISKSEEFALSFRFTLSCFSRVLSLCLAPSCCISWADLRELFPDLHAQIKVNKHTMVQKVDY
jgi:hypothetical protein